MTSTQIILLETIKRSLWGEKAALSSADPDSDALSDKTGSAAVSDADWPDVIKEANIQAVTGLVINGIPEDVQSSAPEQVRGIIRNTRYHQIAFLTRYLYQQSQLVRLFQDANIPLVILKGCSAAVYYPDPALRMMGDIDFLVPSDRFGSAYQLMSENGYIEEITKAPNPRHKGFSKDGIHLELHHHFSYDWLDIESYLTEGLKHAEIREINCHEFPMLPPLANGLVLLAHTGQHLRSGLGLRQAIDWMMYVDQNLDDQFWAGSFRPAAEPLGLYDLAVTMTAMCRKYLGLEKEISWCDEADDILVDSLMKSLLDSGNFGRKHGAGNKVESVIVSFRTEGVLHRLQESGKVNWKALDRHPWLTPFAWFYQIFRYIHQGLMSGSSIPDDTKRGDERARLLQKLGLS